MGCIAERCSFPDRENFRSDMNNDSKTYSPTRCDRSQQSMRFVNSFVFSSAIHFESLQLAVSSLPPFWQSPVVCYCSGAPESAAVANICSAIEGSGHRRFMPPYRSGRCSSEICSAIAPRNFSEALAGRNSIFLTSCFERTFLATTRVGGDPLRRVEDVGLDDELRVKVLELLV